MNDLDLSRPATRQRTSNASRPGLRRIANTRTSNELTANPLQVTGTSRSQSRHRKNSQLRAVIPDTTRLASSPPCRKQARDPRRHRSRSQPLAGAPEPPLAGLSRLAAPCPVWLKKAWIGWLGPDVIWELYAGTEAQACTDISGREWLQHRGSVGRVTYGAMRILGPDGEEAPSSQVGEVWMRGPDGARRRIGTSRRAAPARRVGVARRHGQDG